MTSTFLIWQIMQDSWEILHYI